MSSVVRPGTGHKGMVYLIAIARWAIVPFLMVAVCSPARAQDPDPHHHVALIAPTALGNSPKPVLGELGRWLVDAEIRYEQSGGRLHITSATSFSLMELKAHVEPFGFLVLSLNGETHQNTTGRADPVETDGGDHEVLDDAARAKAEWIAAHPEAYQKVLENASTVQDAK